MAEECILPEEKDPDRTYFLQALKSLEGESLGFICPTHKSW